ncbi:hypothetical protein PEC311524_10670 [Pectobacterium carotovorum subsp. carotovorum]|nr:hypothetical protein PEC311524_10670 [Pectobacterium carotovorum subsp. carotovorum]
MQDFLFESLALQRIDLVARLVADSECGDADRELAISWIAELTASLLCSLHNEGKRDDKEI